jgi:hypothetical protein
MVGVYFQISLRLDREVKEAVMRKKRQHVVEKRDPGVQIGVAGSIESDIDRDFGFLGCSFHSACSFGRHSGPSQVK